MEICVSLILREKKKVKEQERLEVYNFVVREVGRRRDKERREDRR
jgi:hypothetical protein